MVNLSYPILSTKIFPSSPIICRCSLESRLFFKTFYLNSYLFREHHQYDSHHVILPRRSSTQQARPSLGIYIPAHYLVLFSYYHRCCKFTWSCKTLEMGVCSSSEPRSFKFWTQAITISPSEDVPLPFLPQSRVRDQNLLTQDRKTGLKEPFLR